MWSERPDDSSNNTTHHTPRTAHHSPSPTPQLLRLAGCTAPAHFLHAPRTAVRHSPLPTVSTQPVPPLLDAGSPPRLVATRPRVPSQPRCSPPPECSQRCGLALSCSAKHLPCAMHARPRRARPVADPVALCSSSPSRRAQRASPSTPNGPPLAPRVPLHESRHAPPRTYPRLIPCAFQTMDPRLPPLLHHPAVGLPHGHPD